MLSKFKFKIQRLKICTFKPF